jgi:uncharacterized protein YecT (DUF1311 family)
MTTSMKLGAFFAACVFPIAFIPTSPGPPQCENANTTREMVECYRRELASAEDTLATREEAVRQALPPDLASQFVEVGNLWRAYVQRECGLLRTSYHAATMAPLAAVTCRLTFTRNRIHFLEDSYLVGK